MKRTREFHHRTPRWSWMVVMLGAALILPGAELGTAIAVLAGQESDVGPDKGTPGQAERVAVAVLDNCDPNYKGDGPHGDSLRLLNAEGRQLHVVTGLNSSETIGAHHAVAIDAQRSRVYVRENVTNRITSVDFTGHVKWRFQIPQEGGYIGADAIAVDPKTGNVWFTLGPDLNKETTIVIDWNTGNRLAKYPIGGFDIAYDRAADVFWAVGKEIVRIDREGTVLLRRPLPEVKREPKYPAIMNGRNWAAVSVAPIPPRAGIDGAWVCIRQHSEIKGSLNRLVRFDNSGTARTLVELGEVSPFAVTCDGDGNAWVVVRNSVFSVNIDGDRYEPFSIPARAITVSLSTGDLWVTTRDEVLRLNEKGTTVARYRFPRPSSQSWLAAVH